MIVVADLRAVIFATLEAHPVTTYTTLYPEAAASWTCLCGVTGTKRTVNDPVSFKAESAAAAVEARAHLADCIHQALEAELHFEWGVRFPDEWSTGWTTLVETRARHIMATSAPDGSTLGRRLVSNWETVQDATETQP